MNTKNVFPCADSKSPADIIQRTFDQMSLIDDTFFRVVMRDNPKAAEAIVRVALDMPDVEIESVQTQSDIFFGEKKDVRLDLKARRSDGTLFDIEIQKDDEGDLARKSRYCLSTMTMEAMEDCQDFSELPDAYVLFICKHDPFEEGLPVYAFELMDDEGCPLGDGGHIVFFNCSYKGEDPYGKLASDLTAPDFSKIAHPALMDAVKSGKIGERRNEVMTGLSKELYEKGVAMGREADVIALLKDGRNSPQDISEILGIPLEDVLALKEREGI